MCSRSNCLTQNGQYGFSAYTPAGPKDITITDNEISYNDTYNWEKKDPGCGCSGGGKFWDTDGATVTGNYIHDNENVGIWADTDNTGLDISRQLHLEQLRRGCHLRDQLQRLDRRQHLHPQRRRRRPDEPELPHRCHLHIGVRLRQPRWQVPTSNTFSITGNVFTDNWSGVVLWENANRFCGPDSPDNAGSLCTLVDALCREGIDMRQARASTSARSSPTAAGGP